MLDTNLFIQRDDRYQDLDRLFKDRELSDSRRTRIANLRVAYHRWLEYVVFSEISVYHDAT